ncbi:MAG TPA: alanine--tRNA ligase [Longimicrobiales bacterium]|nr:alanine--tRNA ligase [Longimicrobiales bacterium]
MKASEIRQRFLDYFERNGHAIRPSSSLVPADDPTLLFTNAGMVQFKRVFLGEEKHPFTRATTSQKCLRVSGKHNDLEEVGVTARHHTFFEMLGNFSFGDYFKRDAIRFAWELLTVEYGIPRERLWATVHYSDDEAAGLWEEIAGLPPERIFRLGDKDNFWQMGDTGPCGPCSEIHFDLRPEGKRGTDLSVEEFVECGERGEFLELWNLVFMQYNRSAEGELTPLPAPSIDTGAGLERVASVLQGVDSNYKTDLFTPLIERGVEVVGVPYDAGAGGVSYRVLADHARAVAFLLADGVFPSNEGRGYVLRRVLRRAVRHAWLLGRREPTLVHVVDAVVDTMGPAYPELAQRREHLLRATREEEERFLATIGRGIELLDQVAPPLSPEVRAAVDAGIEPRPLISGADVFRLYDTFGFPVDLTELMARERGYALDSEGFEAALEQQRERSRQDRRAAGLEVAGDELSAGWVELDPGAEQEWVGYLSTEVTTDVIACRREDGRVALSLRQNPFYAEAGGQVSDRGHIEGDGWRMVVDDVRRVAGRVAVLGNVEGDFPDAREPFRAHAVVEAPTRADTERNHTATHLLHAALRRLLGTHVLQRGSLVAPDRLRFDFSHPRPMTPDEVRQVEDEVNRTILADWDVRWDYVGYREAVEKGAMALFGEKYGDIVRLVQIPGVSMELCGGTHVTHTAEIGLFRIVSESGVASGVRRIEAVTGTAAYERAVAQDELLKALSATLRTTPDQLQRRVEQLVEENRTLQKQLERARTEGSGDLVGQLLDGATPVDGARVVSTEVEVATPDELRAVGDRLRDRLGSGAAVLAARYPEKVALFAVVTDDLIGKGVRADRLVREVASLTGGSGGGRPHMAQGGVGDPERLPEALGRAVGIVREMLQGAA